MRQVGALAAAQLEMIAPFIRPGVSTGELDRICHDYTINVQDAVPAPLNYRGFPKSICTSVNHVVCHGIPSDEKLLKDGDIINVDVTLIKDGFHGDTSKTFIVGKPSVRAKRLVPRHSGGEARGQTGRHRLRDPVLCGKATILSRTGVLRPWYRPNLP